MTQSRRLALGVGLVALALGYLVGVGAWALVILALVPLVIAVGLRWPVVGFVALSVLATELLGIGSGSYGFRVGGVVDATLAAVLLVCAFVVLGPLRASWGRLASPERAVLVILILVVIATVARAIGTSAQYSIPAVQTLAAARRYLMFLLPIGVLVLALRSERPSRLTDAFLVVASAYSALVLASWLAGGIGALHGFRIVVGADGARAYPAAYPLSLAGAAIAFARLSEKHSRIRWSAMIAVAALCSAAVVSTGSRAAFLALAISAVLILALLPAGPDAAVRHVLPIAITALLVVAALWSGFSAFGFGGRLGEIGQEVVGQTGTFGARVAESQFRLAMVAESPVWGVGFVPFASSSAVAQGYGGITHLETVDSGLVTLLVNFGAIGVIWLLALVIAVGLAYRWRVRSELKVTIWRACLGYLIGGLLTIPTQGHFTTSEGIAASVLIIGLALGESVGPAQSVTAGGE